MTTTDTTNRRTILALDVSLAATGWAVVSLHGQCPEALVAGGCIRTKPERRERIKGADMVRRVGVIAAQLSELIRTHKPIMLVAELPFGSQHAASAVAQGICYGIIGTLTQQHGIPITFATPQAAKKAVTGHKSASKEAVQEAIWDCWPEAATWQGYEHIADALAALVAARQSELYKIAANL